MARIRNPKSKLSYGGLGLKPDEDRLLIKKLMHEDVSLKHQIRKLIRNWIKK